MANIFRTLYRRALDRELGVVGDELTRLADQLDDVTERFHKLQSRVGMRELRAERKGARNDEELVAELRAHAAARGAPKKKNGGEEWPEAHE